MMMETDNKNPMADRDFTMVAKTLKGLEAVLADELRALGAKDVTPGLRMVSFTGDLEMLYRANLCCRTALRILKPFYTFHADDADTLYDRVKEFEWNQILDLSKTFAIETVVNSDTFTHSRFVTYRVKDAIADWFRDRFDNRRPGVRLTDADVIINVHINGDTVTLSLDSSGESLHKRGYRVAQTEAPISEVLAAGIILMSGYKGDTPFIDPMCGSGTFVIEAALIAANIMPGVFRKKFAFENWQDFDPELFDRLYNDDSQERTPQYPIIGCDISPVAADIARRNIRGAGVAKYIDLQVRPLSQWTEAEVPQPAGVLVTNPPYGERISVPDMEALYQLIGSQLKHLFTGWKAWIIGFREEYFEKIGLAPSEKVSLMNGSLDCELREYIIFEGNKRDFRRAGGRLKEERPAREGEARPGASKGPRRFGDRKPTPGDRYARKFADSDRKFADNDRRKGSKTFGDYQKRGDRNNRPAPSLRSGDGSNGAGAPETPVSENPLARRRNPDALKFIQGRQPSLPRPEGPIIRSRGWKKKGE